MYTQEITVNNEVGLHARPATFFIQKANEFKSGIWVEKEDRRVNAKSLLGVLSLGIVKGTTITLIADGADEKNRELLALLSRMAREKKATEAQISLAWMLCKRPWIVPIPGTRKEERMRENAGASGVLLTPDEVRALDDALAGMQMSAVFGEEPEMQERSPA